MLKWLLICLIALCLLVFLIIRACSRAGFGRSDRPTQSPTWFYDHYADRYPRRQVWIPSGRNRLAGFIYGENNDKALIVFSHGSGTFHEEYMKEILWLVDRGYRVFAADYTACGASEGSRTGGLAQTPIDLHAILTWIEQDADLNGMKKVLIGHSWGAYGVTAVLNFDHRVAGVVSLAAYNDPAEQMADILARVMFPAIRLLTPFFRLSDRIDHGKPGTLTAAAGINRAGIPVLAVHGREDQMISFEKCSLPAHSAEIANPHVEYLVMDTPGHCDHDSFRYTERGEDLLKQFRQDSAGLTGAALDRLYAQLNRDEINRVNQPFMERIDEFIQKCTEV